jgi:hypothetical protein
MLFLYTVLGLWLLFILFYLRPLTEPERHQLAASRDGGR